MGSSTLIQAILAVGDCKRKGVVLRIEDDYPVWDGRCPINKQRIYDNAEHIYILLTAKWTNPYRLDCAWEVFTYSHRLYQGKSVEVMGDQNDEWVARYQKYFSGMWKAQDALEFCQAAERFCTHVETGFQTWVTETEQGARFWARKQKPDKPKKKSLKFKRK